MSKRQMRRLLISVSLFMILPATPVVSQVQAGGNVVFNNGRDALTIPFELNSDKIYLSVTINDAGPFWLVLDTGSPAMILDTRVQDALQITTGEGFQVGGAGEKGFILAPADSTLKASLPGLELLNQPAHVGGIDAVVGPYEGRTIDGVLGGYNIFANYIIEIDYGRQTIDIYQRDGYSDPDDGTIVPVHVEGGHCSIESTSVLLDGDTLTGEFILDTGLRGTMVFNTPFVNKHDLLNRFGRTIYTTTGGGLGGQVKTHIGRLKDFIFGGFSLGGLCVSISQLESGALAGEYVAGIIGSAVLQHFHVVFDYAGERLILRERTFDKERLDFDKSGTFLVSDVDDRSVYRIADIIEGSPAEEAGLEIGDIIREIDGTPADQISLEQVRRLFRHAVGTTYSIVYQRDRCLYPAPMKLRKVM